MNTIKNKKIFFKVYVNGNEANGLVKNGVKFYEKVTPHFLLQYTDTSDVSHSEEILNANNFRNIVRGYVSNYKKCKIISYGGIDCLGGTGNSLFRDSENLIELDLSNFNTRNITDMSSMFFFCGNLSLLNLNNFNTSNAIFMGYMFYYCDKLTSLDLSSFNTGNVTNMNNMFAYCRTLTSLKLKNFNTSKVTDMNNMFY